MKVSVLIYGMECVQRGRPIRSRQNDRSHNSTKRNRPRPPVAARQHPRKGSDLSPSTATPNDAETTIHAAFRLLEKSCDASSLPLPTCIHDHMPRSSGFVFVAQNNFGRDDDGSLGRFNKGQADSVDEESIESEQSNEAGSLFTQALSSVVHSAADDDEASLDEHNNHEVAEEELVVDEHVVAHMHDVAAPPDDETVKEDRTTMSEEVRTEYSPAHVCPTGSLTRINN
jgi:hypothetical protein